MSALPHLKRSIGVKIFGAFVVMGLMTVALRRDGASSDRIQVELQTVAGEIVKQVDVLIELMSDHSFIERRKSVMAIESFRHISIAGALLVMLRSASITLLRARGIVRPLSAAA